MFKEIPFEIAGWRSRVMAVAARCFESVNKAQDVKPPDDGPLLVFRREYTKRRNDYWYGAEYANVSLTQM